MRSLPGQPRRRGGAVVVLLALLSVFIVGLVAYSVDLGYITSTYGIKR